MRPRKIARRGASLIEVVIVMGGVAIVLGMSAGLLHLMLRLDRVGRSHFTENAAIGRLARQFRQDVHAANTTRPEPLDKGPLSKLDLIMPEGRAVTYEAREHGLSRTERRGDSVARREDYSLPSCAGPRLLVREDDERSWVSLDLPRDAGAGMKGHGHALHVEALMGRDQRWTKTEETTP